MQTLVPALAKGEFFFRSQDIEAQKEFLSYPKGRNDDIMDSIWYALDKAIPCRLKSMDPGNIKKKSRKRKIIDWMTM